MNDLKQTSESKLCFETPGEFVLIKLGILNWENHLSSLFSYIMINSEYILNLSFAWIYQVLLWVSGKKSVLVKFILVREMLGYWKHVQRTTKFSDEKGSSLVVKGSYRKRSVEDEEKVMDSSFLRDYCSKYTYILSSWTGGLKQQLRWKEQRA